MSSYYETLMSLKKQDADIFRNTDADVWMYCFSTHEPLWRSKLPRYNCKLQNWERPLRRLLCDDCVGRKATNSYKPQVNNNKQQMTQYNKIL